MRNAINRWPVFTSFVLFVVLCATAAYWAMQWLTPDARPVAAVPQDTLAVPDEAAAASLFGGHSSAALAGNFQLKGVVMASNPDESVAILSVNGKPAQAVKARTQVGPGITIREVHKHHVLLDDGGVIKRVELPQNARRK